MYVDMYVCENSKMPKHIYMYKPAFTPAYASLASATCTRLQDS